MRWMGGLGCWALRSGICAEGQVVELARCRRIPSGGARRREGEASARNDARGWRGRGEE